MPDIVIAAYRPKPGKDEALRALLRDHVPFLRREGLVTDRIPILGRAGVALRNIQALDPTLEGRDREASAVVPVPSP